MPVSPRSAVDATPACDECGQSITDRSTYLAGFGLFHTDCVAICACSWAWPASLVETGDVIMYCGTCALAAGRDELM